MHRPFFSSLSNAKTQACNINEEWGDNTMPVQMYSELEQQKMDKQREIDK